jgi:hypothetical protein
VSKAYDTVWTTEFVSKIHTAGMPDTSPLLLASYIADRKFRVKMEENFPTGNKYMQATIYRDMYLI